MDPIDDVTAERDRLATQELARGRAVEAVEVEEAAKLPEALELPEAGNLGETESLLGVVMASPSSSETAALRSSLELDDTPATAVPTNDEIAAEAALLRNFVASDANDAALEADVTEQYEIHDAARAGDRIARAIEAASEDRTVEARFVGEETRAREEFDAHTLDRLTLEQADAAGASAAQAAMSEAAMAAQAVLATQTERRAAAERATQLQADRIDAGERADDAASVDRRARETAATLERARTGEATLDARANELERREHVAAASDRASQAAGEAATANSGAGRPPAARDDDRDREDDDVEVDAVDEVVPTVALRRDDSGGSDLW